jgi:hypothetical protein
MVAQSIAANIDLDLWRKKEERIETLKVWIKGKLDNMENLVFED